jgi:hypothetical protein
LSPDAAELLATWNGCGFYQLASDAARFVTGQALSVNGGVVM